MKKAVLEQNMGLLAKLGVMLLIALGVSLFMVMALFIKSEELRQRCLSALYETFHKVQTAFDDF